MSNHETDPPPRDPKARPGAEPTGASHAKRPDKDAKGATGAAGSRASSPIAEAYAPPPIGPRAGRDKILVGVLVVLAVTVVVFLVLIAIQ